MLFQHEFRKLHAGYADVQALGVDLSPQAVRLAQRNLEKQKKEQDDFPDVRFTRADVLAKGEGNKGLVSGVTSVLSGYNESTNGKSWDILTSNPPYISPSAFNHTTSRSVRNFEPRLALVPEEQYHLPDVDPGDVFYPRLLQLAKELSSSIVLFEVADMDQARRVAAMMKHQGLWTGVEIWRDDPGSDIDAPYDGDRPSAEVPVIGRGNGRSVFAWRGEASRWLAARTAV